MDGYEIKPIFTVSQSRDAREAEFVPNILTHPIYFCFIIESMKNFLRIR